MAETIVITSPETTGDAPADHNQKMIDKANGVTPPDTESSPEGDRPSWLPEKFKTAEDMAKAYASLETKMGSPAPAPPPESSIPDNATVDEALSKGGMSLQEFTTEYDSNGSLAPESYAKLLAAGYDQNLVDSFIEGQKARATLHTSDMKNSAGGVEAYDRMTTWAKGSMTPSEISAYDLAVSSSNHDTAKLAIAGLKSRYESANGRDPTFIKGQSGAASSDAYESNRQITTAMKDPRYKTDSAYRASVVAKLGRSTFK